LARNAIIKLLLTSIEPQPNNNQEAEPEEEEVQTRRIYQNESLISKKSFLTALKVLAHSSIVNNNLQQASEYFRAILTSINHHQTSDDTTEEDLLEEGEIDKIRYDMVTAIPPLSSLMFDDPTMFIMNESSSNQDFHLIGLEEQRDQFLMSLDSFSPTLHKIDPSSLF